VVRFRATHGTSMRCSSRSTAQRYLWRAVNQHGNALDILVQSRRNAVAAKKFFRRLRTGLRHVPRVIVTDKLASY
jgi:putative transposase